MIAVTSMLALSMSQAALPAPSPRYSPQRFVDAARQLVGHCGSAITAECQKERFVYYHCAKKCNASKFLREGEVSDKLGEALKRIAMSPDIVDWMRRALLESHATESEYRHVTLARLNMRKAKLASYADQAYQDRLEARITVELWERKTAEWDRERQDINREIAAHEAANVSYLNEGVQLLELAQAAYGLYVSQPPKQQRRLLDVVLSNCRLTERSIDFDYRKPFDLMLGLTETSEWRGGRDSNPRPPT